MLSSFINKVSIDMEKAMPEVQARDQDSRYKHSRLNIILVFLLLESKSESLINFPMRSYLEEGDQSMVVEK